MFHHAIEITKIDIINHRRNQHGQLQTYQQMNETMSIVKGTCDSNWGDICVLAVGDLYQLPPVGQCPIYISPHTAHTLDDFAPNGWKT